MTSRERFLTALRNGIPDRVPVTPDISSMIPAKRTGAPFRDIRLLGKVSLSQACFDASDYSGLDCWTAGTTRQPDACPICRERQEPATRRSARHA